MANQIINQIFAILQNLKTNATNLNKDLDQKDKREETGGDLAQLFGSFGELRSIMSKLDESDITKLQTELKELMSGKEDLMEYKRDVANILLEAKKRTEAQDQVKAKVIENMPEEKKNENVGSLFDNWGSVLSKLEQWIEQSSSTHAKR